jgi:predicted house-cleaning noncanonical NTP pyrophosphatase (MazG superfamily)
MTDTMDVAKVLRFISENPKFVEILRRALEEEEKHINDPKYLGWEWSDVKAYPAELMKLVREGIAEISYKSRRYTNYRLSNREAVKKALESIK